MADHVFQRRLGSVMHVGRGLGHVAQGRHAEFAPIALGQPYVAGEARGGAFRVVVERAQQIVAASAEDQDCLLYTSPSPRDATLSRMPSSA